MAGGAPRRHDRGPGDVPHPAGLQRIFIHGDGESGGNGGGIDEAHQARQARRLYCGNIPFGLTDVRRGLRRSEHRGIGAGPLC